MSLPTPSDLDANRTLTVRRSVIALLAFAFEILLLLISATTPTKIVVSEVADVQEEMLGITPSPHMIQPYLLVNVNARVSAIIARGLLPCLTGRVLSYPEIETSIEKVQMPLTMRVKEHILEAFKKVKLGHVVPMLKVVYSIMTLIADVVEWVIHLQLPP
jgi:hypothetical protein